MTALFTSLGPIDCKLQWKRHRQPKGGKAQGKQADEDQKEKENFHAFFF